MEKKIYDWCLDYKQMGKCYRTSAGIRDWTKEEMMAYIDWSKSKDGRIEAQVALEMEGQRFSSRRGVRGIWRVIEADSMEQQALHK